MNVYEEPHETGSTPPKPKAEPVKEFKAMPSAERWLAAFAAAVILAYLLRGLSEGYWGSQIFDVCALLGAAGVLALVGPHLFGQRLLSPRSRMYAFAVAGICPAFGYVIGLLSNIWPAVMLAGGVAMGVTAWQIVQRERLLK